MRWKGKGVVQLFPGFAFPRPGVPPMFAVLIRAFDRPLRFAAAHDAMAGGAYFIPCAGPWWWRFRECFGGGWRDGRAGVIFFRFHGSMGSLGQQGEGPFMAS